MSADAILFLTLVAVLSALLFIVPIFLFKHFIRKIKLTNAKWVRWPIQYAISILGDFVFCIFLIAIVPGQGEAGMIIAVLLYFAIAWLVALLIIFTLTSIIIHIKHKQNLVSKT